MKHRINPITTSVLNTLTRAELAALAKSAGVPVGKSKTNTISNVGNAVAHGKLQFKSLVTITLPPPSDPVGLRHGRTVLVKKFRSYRPDKVLTPLPK